MFLRRFYFQGKIWLFATCKNGPFFEEKKNKQFAFSHPHTTNRPSGHSHAAAACLGSDLSRHGLLTRIAARSPHFVHRRWCLRGLPRSAYGGELEGHLQTRTWEKAIIFFLLVLVNLLSFSNFLSFVSTFFSRIFFITDKNDRTCCIFKWPCCCCCCWLWVCCWAKLLPIEWVFVTVWGTGCEDSWRTTFRRLNSIPDPQDQGDESAGLGSLKIPKL